MFFESESIVLPHLNPFSARIYNGTTLEDAKAATKLEENEVTSQRSRPLVTTRAHICTTRREWALDRALFEAAPRGLTPVILESNIATHRPVFEHRAKSHDGKRDSFVLYSGDTLRIGRIWLPTEDQDWMAIVESMKGFDWDEAGEELKALLKTSFKPRSPKNVLFEQQNAPRSIPVFLAA